MSKSRNLLFFGDISGYCEFAVYWFVKNYADCHTVRIQDAYIYNLSAFMEKFSQAQHLKYDCYVVCRVGYSVSQIRKSEKSEDDIHLLAIEIKLTLPKIVHMPRYAVMLLFCWKTAYGPILVNFTTTNYVVRLLIEMKVKYIYWFNILWNLLIYE